MKANSGFGLSELLISLFLTSIIMTTLVQFYLSNKRQYLKAQEVLSARFDLLWVSELLSDSIRRAGFTPCLGIDQLHVIDSRNTTRIISGLIVENEPRQLIQVNRMNEVFEQVIRIKNPFQIVVPKSRWIKGKRPLLIADCEHAEVHLIERVNQLKKGYLITLSKPLVFSYGPSTYVGDWLEEKWLIKANRQGIKSLFYQLVQTEELSSLIHSLQIKNSRVHGKRFLKIILGLDQNKAQKLIVAVRGS